jgi:TolA-binding protein
MNAMTPGENRDAGNGRDVADEKMDQIRDLLFGEFQRAHDQRVSQLEARIRDLDTEVHRRLDALQARLDAYAGESQAERRSTFDELARGIQELGEHVRRIPRE